MKILEVQFNDIMLCKSSTLKKQLRNTYETVKKHL